MVPLATGWALLSGAGLVLVGMMVWLVRRNHRPRRVRVVRPSLDQQIAHLARHGETMAAMMLLHERRRISIGQAKVMVDQLTRHE